MPFWKKKSEGNSSLLKISVETLPIYSGNPHVSPAPPNYRSDPSIREIPLNPYARAQDAYSSRDYSGPRGAKVRLSAQKGSSAQSNGRNRNDLFGNRRLPRSDHNPTHQNVYYHERDRYAEYQQQYQENEEEEEIASIKQEIRFTKQKSLASTQNALAKAQEAEDTGRHALRRLGEQHAKISNIERHIDIAKGQAEDGHGQTKLLKRLNDMPFFVPVRDISRKKGFEERAARRYDDEMAASVRRRHDALEYKQRIDKTLNPRGVGRGVRKKGGQRKAVSHYDRSRYTFEGDAEDNQMEHDIDKNLTQLGNITGRLKLLAIATQKELDHQNHQIPRITRTGEDVQRRVHMNTKRLQTVR